MGCVAKGLDPLHGRRYTWHGEGVDKIAIRDLLTERSGLPDINAFPNYGDILHHHQTPASLIARD